LPKQRTKEDGKSAEDKNLMMEPAQTKEEYESSYRCDATTNERCPARNSKGFEVGQQKTDD
jgi:hypothetical protein